MPCKDPSLFPTSQKIRLLLKDRTHHSSTLKLLMRTAEQLDLIKKMRTNASQRGIMYVKWWLCQHCFSIKEVKMIYF